MALALVSTTAMADDKNDETRFKEDVRTLVESQAGISNYSVGAYEFRFYPNRMMVVTQNKVIQSVYQLRQSNLRPDAWFVPLYQSGIRTIERVLTDYKFQALTNGNYENTLSPYRYVWIGEQKTIDVYSLSSHKRLNQIKIKLDDQGNITELNPKGTQPYQVKRHILPLMKRLEMDYLIDAAFLEELTQKINRSLGSGRAHTQKVLGNYLPMESALKELLGEYKDISDLVMPESSGGDATKTSSKNAVGPWQFVPVTAKEVGLIKGDVDLRRSIRDSTEGARKYVKMLRTGKYSSNTCGGQWPLVLVAWNTGPTRLKNLVQKTPEQKDDYCSIRPRLGKEASNFLNEFLKYVYLRQAYSEHGIKPLNKQSEPKLRVLKTTSNVGIPALADSLNIKQDTIVQFNPTLADLPVIPKDTKVLYPAPSE